MLPKQPSLSLPEGSSKPASWNLSLWCGSTRRFFAASDEIGPLACSVRRADVAVGDITATKCPHRAIPKSCGSLSAEWPITHAQAYPELSALKYGAFRRAGKGNDQLG